VHEHVDENEWRTRARMAVHERENEHAEEQIETSFTLGPRLRLHALPSDHDGDPPFHRKGEAPR